MIIRVRKQDSAYLYQLLESYEGLASFSTLTVGKDVPYRDVVIHAAPDFRQVVEELIERLGTEIPMERVSE
jgi:hypothetical protein